jgi:hypothetical protein
MTEELDRYNDNRYEQWIKRGLKFTASIIVFCFVLLWLQGLISPQLHLYKANVEKKAAVAEAKAHANAAVFLAKAEVTRAEGVAAANKIIAESITDEYVRWLYVDQLPEIDGQIIYVPTEAGIPILEAERLAPEVRTDD